MTSDHDTSAIPAAVAWLTGLGMVPFAGLAVLCITAPEPDPLTAFALLVYGAVILSFVGGIRWGLAITPGQKLTGGALWNTLILSVTPALTAWMALIAPPPAPPFILAAAFALMLASDWRAARAGEAPPWYARLRWPPTVTAIVSLLVVGLL